MNSRSLITYILIAAFLFGCSSEKQPSSINLTSKANEALEYCKENKLNTEFCILVDMRVHSGKNRLYIYDFGKDSIISSGLCSHGCGDSPHGADQTKTSPIFSNIPDSHLSSLGKYKIGNRGYSNWGINVNYKLHGLESSNSNALSRDIVLHSWKRVVSHEIFPNGTPEGWGCPAVSDEQMIIIDRLLQNITPDKNVLLWIYK
tara:strand:- start:230 stop:838 length:609 start_codon:yes stop_codon:yes gene_type:complete